MAIVDDADIEIGTLSGGTALEAVTRGEIDIQISTARAYPRSITGFKRTAMELATLDQDTAGSTFYVLSRGGKKIEGPSVRMAEIIVYAWGNLRAQARVGSIDDTFVSAIGTAMDLERNTASQHETKRRITDKYGKRYNDDMIVVTSNAACSIAFREAVFKLIPRALWKDVYEAAKQASTGEGTMASRRDRALGWFIEKGVDGARILAALGRRGVDDITVDDLITLNGIKTAIKEGDLSIEQAFAPAGQAEPSARASDASARLRDVAAARQARPAPAPKPTPADELDAIGLRGDAPATKPTDQEASAEQEIHPALTSFMAFAAEMQPAGTRPLAGGDDRDRMTHAATVIQAFGEDVSQLRSLVQAPRLSGSQMKGLLAKWEETAAALDLPAWPEPAPSPAAPPADHSDVPPPPAPPEGVDLF